jgi:hypothetical protein
MRVLLHCNILNVLKDHCQCLASKRAVKAVRKRGTSLIPISPEGVHAGLVRRYDGRDLLIHMLARR